MVWKKTFVKHGLGTTTEEEVLLLISFLREEESRTDGAIITLLKNSLLPKSPDYNSCPTFTKVEEKQRHRKYSSPSTDSVTRKPKQFHHVQGMWNGISGLRRRSLSPAVQSGRLGGSSPGRGVTEAGYSSGSATVSWLCALGQALSESQFLLGLRR